MTQRKAGNKGRRNAGKNSKGNQQAERALTTGYVKTVYKTLEYSMLSKLSRLKARSNSFSASFTPSPPRSGPTYSTERIKWTRR